MLRGGHNPGISAPSMVHVFGPEMDPYGSRVCPYVSVPVPCGSVCVLLVPCGSVGVCTCPHKLRAGLRRPKRAGERPRRALGGEAGGRPPEAEKVGFQKSSGIASPASPGPQGTLGTSGVLFSALQGPMGGPSAPPLGGGEPPSPLSSLLSPVGSNRHDMPH